MRAAATLLCVAGVSGCAQDPIESPVGWWHALEGGEIAQLRPPPPGIGQPYPNLGTVPPKPVIGAEAPRTLIHDSLQAEHDRTQRVAARSPIEAVPGVPPPGKAASAPGEAGAPGQAGSAASATLAAADAPAPAAAPPAGAAAAPAGAAGPPAGAGADALPALQTDIADTAPLPPIPTAPPAPAQFEAGVLAEPAPTPPPPAPVRSAAAAGTVVRFAEGSAVLAPSQNQVLRGFAHRKEALIVTGFGETASDLPSAQAEAMALALERARAVADALVTLGVPAGEIRLAADAFGRDAAIRPGGE